MCFLSSFTSSPHFPSSHSHLTLEAHGKVYNSVIFLQSLWEQSHLHLQLALEKLKLFTKTLPAGLLLSRLEKGAHGPVLCLQVVPMLPRLLCEELCSLNPMSDKLTFSVIWTLTPEGKVTTYTFSFSTYLCSIP